VSKPISANRTQYIGADHYPFHGEKAYRKAAEKKNRNAADAGVDEYERGCRCRERAQE
jgi:hypothetical protein